METLTITHIPPKRFTVTTARGEQKTVFIPSKYNIVLCVNGKMVSYTKDTDAKTVAHCIAQHVKANIEKIGWDELKLPKLKNGRKVWMR